MPGTHGGGWRAGGSCWCADALGRVVGGGEGVRRVGKGGRGGREPAGACVSVIQLLLLYARPLMPILSFFGWRRGSCDGGGGVMHEESN